MNAFFAKKPVEQDRDWLLQGKDAEDRDWLLQGKDADSVVLLCFINTDAGGI
jgi:hypothetical protein